MANKPEQEPSIEEILASIRQIISDDEPRESAVDLTHVEETKPEIKVAPAPVAPKPEPKPEPRPEPKPSFEDVLELTNEIREEPKKPEPVAIKPLPPEPKFELPIRDEEPVGEMIFSEVAAEATTQAFSRLIGNIPVERDENRTLYADGRITLEDIVKDMLRPMLRDWVNTHVPRMVERMVEKELEKLARQARDD